MASTAELRSLVEQGGIDPGVFEVHSPEWETRGYAHIRVTESAAQKAVREIALLNGIKMKDVHEAHDGQKGYDRTKLVEISAGDDHNRGAVQEYPHHTQVRRARQWWKPDHRTGNTVPDGMVPEYAYFNVPVVRREIAQEQQLAPNETLPLAAHGFESEFGAAMIVGGRMIPVDVQHVIAAIEASGIIPTTAEGWRCQFEYPSHARLNGQSMSDHESAAANNLAVLSAIFQRLGIYIVPTGVIPFPAGGQANFDSAHVLNVLTSGMAAALGRDLSIEEAAAMLEGYGTCGLHVTAGLHAAEDGTVGDELLNTVFRHTHGRIIPLLKVWTHSSNLESPDAITGSLSTRELNRKHLPTARVGEARRFFDPTVISGVEQGLTPSLERASLFGPRGIPGEGTHNPLGRQKEMGRNETTVWDNEPNVSKITWIESLIALYTTAVQAAALRPHGDPRSLQSCINDMDSEQSSYFLGILTNQQGFESLVSNVDSNGVSGEVVINGSPVKIGDVVIAFCQFVREFAELQGIMPSAYPEDFGNVQKLESITVRMLQNEIATTFTEYFDPEHENYACGTVAHVARIRFMELTPMMDEESARQQVLKELCVEYQGHLTKLSRRPQLEQIREPNPAPLQTEAIPA